MPIAEVIKSARETLATVRVFSEPIERDGLTVITAATVSGGGGGGEGQEDNGRNGEGGGFGLHARPAGAYVITGGGVTWHPAINVNMMVAASAAVTIAYFWLRARTNVARARHGG